MWGAQPPLFKSILPWKTVLPDDAEEEKLPVLTAQGVTLEDYDTTDEEYEYSDGYEDC